MSIFQDSITRPHDAAPLTVADAEQARARIALQAGDSEDAAQAFELAATAYEAAGATSMSAWCRQKAENVRQKAG